MIKSNNLAIKFDNVSYEYTRLRNGLASLKYLLNRTHSLYVTNKIFSKLSFEIAKGEIIGIIGRNGAGKSTLLKLMAGLYPPSEGKVETWGRVSPLMDLGAGFHPELSAEQNINLNSTLLKNKNIDPFKIAEWAGLVKQLGDPIRTFSSGMIGRLAFSIATSSHPDLLLIDEVLSVGDHVFQEKSMIRMKEMFDSGGTIVLVSHNLELMIERCSRVMWIENGEIREFGKPKKVVALYLNNSF
jgi:ABC-type polysaccharide/polyol phosphate transport system ATPase subunit